MSKEAHSTSSMTSARQGSSKLIEQAIKAEALTFAANLALWRLRLGIERLLVDWIKSSERAIGLWRNEICTFSPCADCFWASFPVCWKCTDNASLPWFPRLHIEWITADCSGSWNASIALRPLRREPKWHNSSDRQSYWEASSHLNQTSLIVSKPSYQGNMGNSMWFDPDWYKAWFGTWYQTLNDHWRIVRTMSYYVFPEQMMTCELEGKEPSINLRFESRLIVRKADRPISDCVQFNRRERLGFEGEASPVLNQVISMTKTVVSVEHFQFAELWSNWRTFGGIGQVSNFWFVGSSNCAGLDILGLSIESSDAPFSKMNWIFSYTTDNNICHRKYNVLRNMETHRVSGPKVPRTSNASEWFLWSYRVIWKKPFVSSQQRIAARNDSMPSRTFSYWDPCQQVVDKSYKEISMPRVWNIVGKWFNGINALALIRIGHGELRSEDPVGRDWDLWFDFLTSPVKSHQPRL
jgi:hypothetical protein